MTFFPKPVTRQELIKLGLLKPASHFFRLRKDDPERERYCTLLILGSIDPWPSLDQEPLRGRMYV